MIELEHLDEFANAPGIEHSFAKDTASVTATGTELAVAVLPHGTLRTRTKVSFDLSERQATLRLPTVFVAEPNTPVHVNDVDREWIGPLRDLVALATAAPTSVLSVGLRPALAATQESVQLAARTIKPQRKGRERFAAEMLFNLPTLPAGFESSLKVWWGLREALRAVVADLHGLLHAPFWYTSERFVTTVRAAETLHASLYEAVPAADAEHEARVRRLRDAIASLSEHEQAWVEGMIEHSKPATNRHRVQDLLTRLGSLGEFLAGGDPSGFARRVVLTRNALTHPKQRPARDALTELDPQHWHAEVVAWVIRAHLLLALGYSHDEVTRRFTANWPLQQIVERARIS